MMCFIHGSFKRYSLYLDLESSSCCRLIHESIFDHFRLNFLSALQFSNVFFTFQETSWATGASLRASACWSCRSRASAASSWPAGPSRRFLHSPLSWGCESVSSLLHLCWRFIDVVVTHSLCQICSFAFNMEMKRLHSFRFKKILF